LMFWMTTLRVVTVGLRLDVFPWQLVRGRSFLLNPHSAVGFWPFQMYP
jgi:hypothetical protein